MSRLNLQQTIRALADETPEILPVLEKMGVDFETVQDATLGEICEKRGLSSRTLSWLLEAAKRDTQLLDWKTLKNYEIPQLVGYILFNHHDYAERELPRLEQILEDAVRQDGADHPELLELQALFRDFKEFFLGHMREEERQLFPFCLMSAAYPETSRLDEKSIERLIHIVQNEDQEMTLDLERLRQKTRWYHVPENVGEYYRKLMQGLRTLEIDLRRHIRVENQILFPKVVAAQVKLLKGGGANASLPS